MKIPTPGQLRPGLSILLLLGAVNIVLSAPTPTPTPVQNGKIAFGSFLITGSDFEVIEMDGNGLNRTNLTVTPSADDFSPSWSKDGTKIVFTSNRDGNYEVYRMDANGSNQARLTNNLADDGQAAWSPDGTKIVFSSYRDNAGDNNSEVYLMDANGANQTNLTNNLAYDADPAWSPDGTKIVFSSLRDGNSEIYVMNADGSGQTNLTNNPAQAETSPKWSPDGTKIVYVRSRPSLSHDIWVMNANGSNQTGLTNNLFFEQYPAWSPDGTKIVLTRYPQFGGFGEIYVMDANGANSTNLTNGVTSDSQPSWQPIFGVGTPTPVPTVTPSPTPTATATPPATATPTPPPVTPTPTPSPTPSPTPTPLVTPTPGLFCSWFAAAPVPVPVYGNATTSLGSNLYSFGGRSTGGTFLNNAYKFNGSTWTPIASLPTVVFGASAVSDGTNIYVLGGGSTTVYKYDPVANSYTTLAPFSTETSFQSAVYLAGKIYKFCGAASPFTTDVLEIYDIATNSWTAGASYPQSAISVAAFAHGNYIYGAGGTIVIPSLAALNTTYRYDPATDTWNDAAIASLPATRTGAAAAFYNGAGVLAGGTVGGTDPASTSASVIAWDAASNTWSNLPNMLTGRTNAGAAAIGPFFYVIGGNSVAATNGTNDNQGLLCPPASTPTPSPTPPVTPTPSPTSTPGVTPTPSSTPTPSTTPTPTPSSTPTPSTTPTTTPGTTPTPTTTPTPSTTPAPTPPTHALNISTRMRVETGNNVLIGGFIVTGSAPKNVAVRGIGPSLSQSGISDFLADPTLELRNSSGALLVQNDNWQDDPVSASQLTALGLGLQDPNESGIVASLPPSAYTAVLAGKNDGTGVGLVEVYDINQAASSELANISTRGFVLTGNNVMIGGFILGGNHHTHVAVRGIGPSLSQQGLSPVLDDPTLELHDGNGTLLVANDNWQDDPVSASQLTALGLGPQDPLESGIYVSLPPGTFTAVLAGKNDGTGIGLVEVYNVH